MGKGRHVEPAEKDHLERIIAVSNLLPVHFLSEGAIVQKAVARVTRNGSGWATGFMVSPSLFLTNNHVISSTTEARLMKMEFNYQLDYLGNPQDVDTYTPDPDSVFHTNVGLDYTLIRLNAKPAFLTRPYESNHEENHPPNNF